MHVRLPHLVGQTNVCFRKAIRPYLSLAPKTGPRVKVYDGADHRARVGPEL